MRRVTTLLARQRLVVVAATTTITTIKVAHANAAHELSRPPPRAASQFAVERALEHAKALALAKRQNLIRRIYSHCRRCARLLYAWARLSSLATPLVLAAPIRASLPRSDALDELWWRYMLWATQTAGPTAVKLAQWASSREDRFPAAFCERFSHLQDRVTERGERHQIDPCRCERWKADVFHSWAQLTRRPEPCHPSSHAPARASHAARILGVEPQL
jgi:hypothetical protein